MFVVHSHKNMGSFRLEGLIGQEVETTPTTRFDVEFHLLQNKNGLSGNAVYSTDLFKAKTICGLVAVFADILRRGLNDPNTPRGSILITNNITKLYVSGLFNVKIKITDDPKALRVVNVFRA